MLKKTISEMAHALAAFVLIAPFFCTNAAPTGFENVDTPEYNLYFGDLHAHTSFSDGLGTPYDAYASAIEGGADFMAVTDHHYLLSEEDWQLTQVIADEFTSEDFVAIAAFEYFITGWGEVNVFNYPVKDMGIWDHGYKGLPHQTALPAFYDTLASEPDAVGLWVHPTWAYSKEFDDFAYRTDSRDRGMGLCEVHNYGNWEYYGWIDDEPSYQKALDAGWHVMPAANSDTHADNWIVGYECRTVLMAESLTRENLYEAMSECRGYATIDKNLRMSYELNGQVMGSILPAPASEYMAEIVIEDPDHVSSDDITLVEIVSDFGQVVAALECSDTTVEWTVTLSSDDARYFYVRVSTASNVPGEQGLTAWSAPIWTGL
jgi:hypothetical protein